MLTSAEMYYLASAIHAGTSQAPRTLSEIQKQPPELFCEKGVLKISQNSQENTSVGVPFLIKLQV